MAIKPVTVTPGTQLQGATNFTRYAWRLAQGDTGSPITCMDFADATVQIGGASGGADPEGVAVVASLFGAAGSVTLEGTNDGVNWFPLTDPQGNAVTKTAPALEVIEEAPRMVRPNCTAGDGTTDIAVILWGRRNR